MRPPRPPQKPPDQPNRAGYRLPFGALSPKGVGARRRVIAHHLLLTGYGHWLPNDLRGSGSIELKQPKLEDLGPIHHGRKQIQPSRQELKAFYREANELLEHTPFWMNDAKRQAAAAVFAQVIERYGYTVWACAVCSNHVHFCIRAHRDSGEMMWERFAHAGRIALRDFSDVTPDHPVWTSAPYDVFLFTPGEVFDRIGYINQNPMKDGLPPQSWPFVTVYDGWPLNQLRR